MAAGMAQELAEDVSRGRVRLEVQEFESLLTAEAREERRQAAREEGDLRLRIGTLQGRLEQECSECELLRKRLRGASVTASELCATRVELAAQRGKECSASNMAEVECKFDQLHSELAMGRERAEEVCGTVGECVRVRESERPRGV